MKVGDTVWIVEPTHMVSTKDGTYYGTAPYEEAVVTQLNSGKHEYRHVRVRVVADGKLLWFKQTDLTSDPAAVSRYHLLK